MCFIYHKEFYLTANKQIHPQLEHKEFLIIRVWLLSHEATFIILIFPVAFHPSCLELCLWLFENDFCGATIKCVIPVSSHQLSKGVSWYVEELQDVGESFACTVDIIPLSDRCEMKYGVSTGHVSWLEGDGTKR